MPGMSYSAPMKYNAYGLFTLVNQGPTPTLWEVRVLGHVIAALPYDEAHSLWRSFVDKAAKLDGDARMLAIAWATAAAAQDNLTATQNRCTELIQEARALKRQLTAVREQLYVVKFAVEQGTTPMAVEEALTKALDCARQTDLPPAP